MFLSPIFGGCKYTNNFLFINNNIEFQHLGLLITHGHLDIPALPEGVRSRLSRQPVFVLLSGVYPVSASGISYT